MSGGEEHFCEIKLLLTIPLMLLFKSLVHVAQELGSSHVNTC